MMTTEGISQEQKVINAARKAGFDTEALVRTHHLNFQLLQGIVDVSGKKKSSRPPKYKRVVRALHKQGKSLKSITSPADLKSINAWADDFPLYLKNLRAGVPANTESLLTRSTKVTSILLRLLEQVSKSKSSVTGNPPAPQTKPKRVSAKATRPPRGK
jgi:hypothetical protein